MSHHLPLVEDDHKISIPLVRTLEREGYAVERVSRGRDALVRVRDSDPDLVPLDLGLPDIDGTEVCRSAREAGFAGGIIILTARGGELDRVVGLDVGADDYNAKPFGLAQLLARTRALLLRGRPVGGPGGEAGPRPSAPPSAPEPAPSTGSDHDVSPGPPAASDVTGDADRRPAVDPGRGDRAGALRVDVGARRAWAGTAELVLTAKEFAVLVVLDSDRGSVLTRKRLMDETWDENWYGSTKTLDTTVGRLRAKLEESGCALRIATVRGVGFRLESDPVDA